MIACASIGAPVELGPASWLIDVKVARSGSSKPIGCRNLALDPADFTVRIRGDANTWAEILRQMISPSQELIQLRGRVGW
jgi:hypothetical protein